MASDEVLRHCQVLLELSEEFKDLLHEHLSHDSKPDIKEGSVRAKMLGLRSRVQIVIFTSRALLCELVFASTGKAYITPDVFRGGVVAVMEEEFRLQNLPKSDDIIVPSNFLRMITRFYCFSFKAPFSL